ncbi:PfkB family carbohydrate kinase [uncultured Thomasclavelia sp.]|uniref:PfkB family carbohydrate kinase n=1 Tax=uncultured Thomasclavelia sp. TaxID=3025759 RepID=UPI0035A747A2
MLFLSNEQLPGTPESFIEKLKQKYSFSICVIGLGAYGAMLYIHSNDQTFLLPPAKVTKVVNTIGAGDVSFASFIFIVRRWIQSKPCNMHKSL